MDLDFGCNTSGECGLSFSVHIVAGVSIVVFWCFVYWLHRCHPAADKAPTYSRAEDAGASDAPRRRARAAGPIC